MYYEGVDARFISKRLGSLSGRALLRVDMNVPVKGGRVSPNNIRFKECAKSIQAYVRSGIIPIIITHQGRKGDSDYMESLEEHAKVLNSMLDGIEVVYSDTMNGPETERAIRSIGAGQALLLKNVRDHPDEKKELKTKDELRNCESVKSLSRLADFYINDAPATMHRADTSLLGFRYAMDSYLGLQMEKELAVLREMKREIDSGKWVSIIFGGKKWEKFEYIYKIAQNRNVRILCGGIPGQSIAYLRHTGDFDSKNEGVVRGSGSLDTASKLLNNFSDRILYPVDFVLEDGSSVYHTELKAKNQLIMDIGEETLDRFFKVMDGSDVIIYAGPVGRYEDGFNKTIRLVSRAMSINAKSFTLGGHSADSMDDISFDKSYEALGGKRITSGGSGLAFLAGDRLPPLEAFESSGT